MLRTGLKLMPSALVRKAYEVTALVPVVNTGICVG